MGNKVLILAGYYAPSVKAGGPVQSIKNLVEQIGDNHEFYILANDRDLGDDAPFNELKTNQWIQNGNSKVYYINYMNITTKIIQKIIKEKKINVLYLNSVFDFKLSILPIIMYKLKKINVDKVIVASRGNFTIGALKIKKTKKIIYLKISRFFKLYKNITWHATSEIEKKEIIKEFKPKQSVIVANNLTANYLNIEYNKKIKKKSGELKLVYISRIHPMKNLLTVLKILTMINGNIEFNIYGPVENQNYWTECQNIIKKLPENIIVKYHGLIQNDKVMDVYKKSHVFVLLTLGENFGHAISEALIGGCPVIISDRTPWRNLEKEKVGWDLSLEDNKVISERINYFVTMDNDDYNEMSKNAFIYSQSQSNKKSDIKNYIELFNINVD